MLGRNEIWMDGGAELELMNLMMMMTLVGLGRLIDSFGDRFAIESIVFTLYLPH